MRLADNDEGMGAFVVSVEVDDEGTFEQVPQVGHAVEITINTITFHCPNQNIPVINNAPDNTIFRVEVHHPARPAPNSLYVEQYPYEQ
ncbi:hypothetical protein F2P45_12960 [Massilia sp. CCM 8733]|uniref:Uncharacterized protein n=1 Tax=Massilia mucilaginosa TaxID=2609282 RepID=A0ABX0NSM9_9BURK|nr:hypothetical protein [Massilia mucilaginosa]NHZ89916.1 hypothetical protein [Massilia mucilaginosa]